MLRSTILAVAMATLCAIATAWAVDAPPGETADVTDTVQEAVLAEWETDDERFAAALAAESSDPDEPVATSEDASGGCDGVKNGRWGFHTASKERDPWWQVDLGDVYRIERIVVYNRTDRNTAARTSHLQILVSEGTGTSEFHKVYQHDGTTFYGAREGKPLVVRFSPPVRAQIVRLMVPGRCSFALDEVEVFPVNEPQTNIALNKAADQKSVSRYSYPGTLPEDVDSLPPPVAADRPLRYSPEHLQELIRRIDGLMARIAPQVNAPLAATWQSRRDDLSGKVGRVAENEAPLEVRREVYLAVRRLLREVAFANPLFDFDRLLFVKRHDAAGVFHMCDQYYGCNARPGGGIYVLHDPVGPHPHIENLLVGSVAENGRLQGQKLEGGSFLSPELSYDGKTILFAYSEAKAFAKTGGQEAYLWEPEYSYHIFRVDADGDNLRQLTDGPWNDFDPCFLPDGRVAFISERRGGYLRCGRHCPVYALHSMEPDGSDIIRLSYHETHEWQPSVTNDGMIVYTRWDYVDRDTNVAHHIWTCYPDGRDPRSFHGNYPQRRELRPWMEMQLRAVPDSSLFVGVAAAHHGHEFGSLILIDPRLRDDGATSQIIRLTPDVPFPEAEGRPVSKYMVYGTPWPLSEEDYLCVYGAEGRNRGIFWIDRDGNRELIYRDPEISCYAPIPMKPRPKPPVIPRQTVHAERDVAAAGGQVPPATVAVLNIYESDFTWPEERRAEELRVIQVLPKTTAPPNAPRIGIGFQTNARRVLGTVPVEPDGSVYFEAPPGKQIYFQVLDENGMAIQSMRSGTYVHPGEQLTCVGCHESKHRSSYTPPRLPLALQRKPSQLEPEPEGSNPFNYVRLVQPVLDRHCVSCHDSPEKLDLRGRPGGPFGWTVSYTSLAEDYGYYFNVSNGSLHAGVHGGSRTPPGRFGAAAAPLLKYLGPEHYGVQLSFEELRRITLWLDCNSEFYGSYEDIEAQARGEIVFPTLD